MLGNGLLPNNRKAPSLGLVFPNPSLGSNVITNGGFDTNTAWTRDTGWSIGSGVATKASNGLTGNITQTALTANTWYHMDWTITEYTNGAFGARFGSNSGLAVGIGRNASNTYVDTGRAAGTGVGIRGRNTGSAGSIDNIAVYPLTLSSLISNTEIRSGTIYEVETTPTLLLGTQAGLAFQLDSTTSPLYCIFGYHDGTNAVLEKLINGVWTTLINVVTAYVAGASIKINRNGTTYQLWYNGTQVGSNTTISDGGLGTLHGLFSTYGGNTFDTFT